MPIMNIQRDVIILTLQLTIMRNAALNGWNVRRLNDKQIELTKKWNKNDNYEKICCELIFFGNKLFSEY